MLEKGNDDWDNDSWELSNWFTKVAKTVKPHSYSQMIAWAKTEPNWRKDLQIYEHRMRARKIKQNRMFN